MFERDQQPRTTPQRNCVLNKFHSTSSPQLVYLFAKREPSHWHLGRMLVSARRSSSQVERSRLAHTTVHTKQATQYIVFCKSRSKKRQTHIRSTIPYLLINVDCSLYMSCYAFNHLVNKRRRTFLRIKFVTVSAYSSQGKHQLTFKYVCVCEKILFTLNWLLEQINQFPMTQRSTISCAHNSDVNSDHDDLFMKKIQTHSNKHFRYTIITHTHYITLWVMQTANHIVLQGVHQ